MSAPARKKHYLVIGAGLAGSLLANRLSDHRSSNNCHVTVLEIGPGDSIVFPPVNYPNKELAHVRTFCHGTGGGTNLWHNGLLSIQPADVVDETFRSVLEDGDRFTDQAASQLHFRPPSFRNEMQNLSPEVQSLANVIGDCTDGVDSLIYPKKFAPLKLNPSVRSFNNVSDIQFSFSGSRITAVRFAAEGDSESLAVDNVIISCGTVGSPGVLTGMLETIGASTSSVGTGFIDHPMGFIGKFRFPKSIATSVRKFALLDRDSYECRNVVRLKSECGKYTGCAFFRPTITMNNDLATYKYKSLLGNSRGWDLPKNALTTKVFHPDIIAEIVSHVFPFDLPTRTYSVLFIGEQRKSSSSVSASDNSLTVDWTISDEEIAIYNAMVLRLREFLTDSSENSVIQSELTPDWLWSAAHHSATTPMGDSSTDVIDSDLRVKCTDNAYVCDASVIQEHSYANTGLTIAQLALRLAERLQKE